MSKEFIHFFGPLCVWIHKSQGIVMALEILGAIISLALILPFRKHNVFYRVGWQTTGNALNLKTPFSTERVP